MERYKRPDHKNALSILLAANREMKFTLTLEVNENSGTTIVRNIYECFRMLGDAILTAKGLEGDSHIESIRELSKLKVNTTRPINLVDSLRQLRHNINYYGYRPTIAEINDALSIARSLFKPLSEEVLKIIDY